MADLRASGLGGVPRGTTAQRPSSPSIGDVFYNGTLGCLEIYTLVGWVANSAPASIPINVVATDTGSGRAYNNGRASISFSDGSGGGLVVDYIITPSPSTSPATFTGSASPIIVTGLQSATSYTYTIQARNNFGTSLSSAASTGVTATTVPQAPTIGTASIAGNGSSDMIVSWTLNSNGGSNLTSIKVNTYVGTSNTLFSTTTATSTNSTSATITGLTQNTQYTFKVFTTNINGDSLESSGVTATTDSPFTVSYLVIAGGGGSGADGEITGGGGAGGYRSSVSGESSGRGASAQTPYTIWSGTTMTLTVGGGGAKGSPGVSSSITGSGLTTVSCSGGGWGGRGGAYGNNGSPGGSGGGGYHTGTGGSGTTGEGYDGGNGYSNENSGGGGGAGGVGQNGTSTAGGSGGIGIASSITGSSVYRAGGGGGSKFGGPGASGGTGGGGNGGGYNPGSDGSNGTANTGGGAGGSRGGGASYSGGSGIVILRSSRIAASTTGSPTYTNPSAGVYIYQFLNNGSITF